MVKENYGEVSKSLKIIFPGLCYHVHITGDNSQFFFQQNVRDEVRRSMTKRNTGVLVLKSYLKILSFLQRNLQTNNCYRFSSKTVSDKYGLPNFQINPGGCVFSSLIENIHIGHIYLFIYK